ncbi:low temperature requirement protein A [Mesorhizobium sp. PAMC28654]|uniref:low temperature requirement protein A n=1 Tax=Mesorhizobium sp. PAMC28654 TaxID=2880934 RepID=UPI001D0A240F|nr:low temperature requirement protein A [Mesorhizobium sp. PAMC28654]UDL87328.1 low temperature requirement protein A [Mesorhizobium sp. PAMC28654]
MNTTPVSPETLDHHIRRMAGRDPHEAHRVATPLELLFDLTFATAFSFASAQLAHGLAEGHYTAALLGFAFASFAICWAWINFSWFSSAYDTDDWIFRLVTMVQMIGVLVLAIGLPRMFASIEHGEHLNNSVMVLGYVIMRVAMLFQWLRAARQDPVRRRACLTYAIAIAVAQIGWVVQILVDFSVGTSIILAGILGLIELAGPVVAERRDGGTPWHAHHMAERYSLFAIIALGEGVVGTLATLSAVVEEQGWSMDAFLVCIAGTGLTFGMWWVYYMLPSAPILHAHRGRAFIWGYGQMLIVVAIVATGAGLHVAAYFIEHKAGIGPLPTLLAAAVPVSVFLVSIYALYTYLVRRFDPFHIWLLGATAAVVALAVFAALAGVDMAVCLVILMFAPAVTVVGYEMLGHRHQAEALATDER